MKARCRPDDCAPLIEAAARGEVELVARGRGQYPGAKLPAGALPGLRSIGCWNAVGPQTWGLPMHRNEGIELCVLLSGETAFATDHEECVLRSGDLTITRPWQRHRLGDPRIGACRLFWFILDVESTSERPIREFPGWIGPDQRTRRDLLRVLRRNPSCRISGAASQLREVVAEGCQRLASPGPFVLAHIANLINTLLFDLSERLAWGAGAETADQQGFDHTIRQFFQGMEASLDKASEPWTVDEMARICRVGKSYLTRSCRRIFNATPGEQLNWVRLNHARRLLLERPGMTVTEVAMASGFNTSQYFATRFRRKFGLAPQQFRLRQPPPTMRS